LKFFEFDKVKFNTSCKQFAIISNLYKFGDKIRASHISHVKIIIR